MDDQYASACSAWNRMFTNAPEGKKKSVEFIRDTVDGNNRCNVCRDRDTTFVVLDFQTFVCKVCAEVHTTYGHRTCGIDNPQWTDAEIEQVQQGGNVEGAKFWLESWTEELFARPTQDDTDRIREFIRKAYIVKCWKRQLTEAEIESEVKQLEEARLAKAKAGKDAAKSESKCNPDDQEKATEANHAKEDLKEDLPRHSRRPSKMTLIAEGYPTVKSEVASEEKCEPPLAPQSTIAQSEGPQFCPAHNSSFKRQKDEPSNKPCLGCKQDFNTTYARFSLCVGCSMRRSGCMICASPIVGLEVQPEPLERDGSKLGSSSGSTSPGDGDSCSDETGSEPREVPAAPLGLLDDLLGAPAAFSDTPAVFMEQPAETGELDGLFCVTAAQPLPSNLQLGEVGWGFDLATPAATLPVANIQASIAQPTPDEPAVSSSAPAKELSPFDAIRDLYASSTEAPPLSTEARLERVMEANKNSASNGVRDVAPKAMLDDPFASVKGLYQSSPEPPSGILAPRNSSSQQQSFTPDQLAKMDAAQLMNLQQAVEQSLQQQQRLAAPQVVYQAPVPVFDSSKFGQPPAQTPQTSTSPVTEVFIGDPDDFTSKNSSNDEFADLLGAMQAKAADWEAVKTAKQSPYGSLIDLL